METNFSLIQPVLTSNSLCVSIGSTFLILYINKTDIK